MSRQTLRTLSLPFLAWGSAAIALAQPLDVVPVHVDIVYRPISFPSDGKYLLAYELHATNAGNQAVLDLGEGRYAFYAHKQPGSIRVKAGQRLRKAQTLALLGNSGNSTAPHLHFHVSDGPTILEGKGLPYVIDRFRRDGVEHRNKLPLQDWKVDFSCQAVDILGRIAVVARPHPGGWTDSNQIVPKSGFRVAEMGRL